MSKYRINENELGKMIGNAPQQILHIAQKKENKEHKRFDELKGQWKHRRLSQAWVKYLGRSLEKFYRDNNHKKVYAFPSQFDLKEKLGIKQKEFLFDVSVGLYESFESNMFEGSKKVPPIYYQSQSIWQIESEFAENTREIAIDFSKLLAGNSDYAMMVSPVGKGKKNENITYYMNEMAKMLKSENALNGKTLYFLLLPHPREWVNTIGKWNNGGNWHLYKWNGIDWDKVITDNEWIIENEVNTPLQI